MLVKIGAFHVPAQSFKQFEASSAATPDIQNPAVLYCFQEHNIGVQVG